MIFPLAAAGALTIVLNGSVVRSYNAPYVEQGRVMAPLDPFVTAIAATIEYSGGELLVRRADRFAQVSMPEPPQSARFQSTYVAIAPLLRTLGARVSYDPVVRRLFVQINLRTPCPTPTPFNEAVPRASPTVVFTPPVQPTPRPVVSGIPAPRRTPIPAPLPSTLPNRR